MPKEKIYLKNLDIDMIPPVTKKMYDKDHGGSKIVVIGKPGTGKSTLISDLLYSKKHIIPSGIVMSGTEDSNGHYGKIFPKSFIYHDYEEEAIEKFIERQKIAKKHLKNPWSVLLIDDCTDDAKIFNKPLQQGLYKRGRHWKTWYILSLQYAMDVKKSIRNAVDGVFILREPLMSNRKSIWENYASIIPDFSLFCEIMDQVTQDYHAIYIDNFSKKNDWRECVYWYKARPDLPKDFKFGSKDFWEFHNARYEDKWMDI